MIPSDETIKANAELGYTYIGTADDTSIWLKCTAIGCTYYGMNKFGSLYPNQVYFKMVELWDAGFSSPKILKIILNDIENGK